MRKGHNSQGSMPFYEPPAKHKTSAEIISEARALLHRATMESTLGSLGAPGGAGAPRPLGTQRPFTPRDRQRTLFGKAGKASRPPSAVSLRYLQLQSNDSLMAASPAVKRVQLSPMPSAMSSSLDERTFKHLLLDNIDEKPELTSVRKKRADASRRTKSLQLDCEEDNASSLNTGSKLRLPSLNGLAKPLHQRKIGNRATFMLHSLSEEREDSITNTQDTFSPLTSSKSSDSMLKKPLTGSQDKESIEHFPEIPHTISLEVFNKRRLFGDFKSKSEDIKQHDFTMNSVPEKEKTSDQCEETIIEKVTETESKDNAENCKSPLDNGKSNPVKLALQIPSPELNFHIESPSRTEFSPSKIAAHSLTDQVKESSEIINRLMDHHKNLTDEEVISNLKFLYNTLESEGPWQDIRGDEKAIILKTLYNFVESSNERLLMAIARIILALRVTGSNLSGVCKLIFKVARNDKNDHLFFNDNTLELFMVGLGRAEPLQDAECLVYGYGALKFLGMSPALLGRMRPLGALPLMTLHLHMFNAARLENATSVGEQGLHALYQLTGALRNLAGGGNERRGRGEGEEAPVTGGLPDFMASGAVTQLCRSIELYADDLDVETNVSRTLSVLSADFDCCVSLCEQKGLLSGVVRLLERHTDRAPLIVRITYILGNMVACNDDTRLELYEEPGAVDALQNVLDVYLKRCWPGGEFDSAENIIIGSDLDGSSGSDEDVMVKTVRVLANMCMNGVVGTRLATSPAGARILTWLAACLRRHGPPGGAELAASALAALNNLTYYHRGEGTIATVALQLDLCEALCRLLPMEVGPCVTEAARVLGNMSRNKITRDFIVDTGALMDITRLLISDEEETAVAAAGVLVNMAADPGAREAWLAAGGGRTAAGALARAASRHSWPRAQLLCQALWNAAPLPPTDCSLLAPLLLNILDEQQLFGDVNDFMNFPANNITDRTLTEEDVLSSHIAWEEFAVVAVNLLEKIDPTLDSPYEEDNEEFYFGARTRSESDLTPL